MFLLQNIFLAHLSENNYIYNIKNVLPQIQWTIRDSLTQNMRFNFTYV